MVLALTIPPIRAGASFEVGSHVGVADGGQSRVGHERTDTAQELTVRRAIYDALYQNTDKSWWIK